MTRRACILVAAAAATAAVAFVGAAPARAAEDPEALIRQGLALRMRGEDQAALPLFERAYALAPSPRSAAQLGFAEQALQRWPDAERHVSEALRAEGDPWIRKNRPVIARALASIRSHVGRVEIGGGQRGGSILVNGKFVGTLPLPDAIAVAPGIAEIELRTAGGAPVVKRVTVAEGGYARVSLATEPPPAPRPAPRPTPAARPAPVVVTAPSALVPAAPAQPLVQAPRDQGDDRGGGTRAAGIALLTGGAVAAGLGVGATLLAKHKFDAINADARADRPYDESNGDWKTYERAATVLYISGAAGVIAGALLYRAGGSSRAEVARAPARGAVSVRPLVAPQRAGATLAVRF